MKQLFLLLCCLLPSWGFAQMTFTYTHAPISQTQQSNGTTSVTLPAGTPLTGCITAVQVEGVEVDPSLIVPNPTLTRITEKEIETFVYQDKAYSFLFQTEPDYRSYFTMVVLSDPHIEHGAHDAVSVSQMQTYVQNILHMGKEGGRKFTFSKLAGYTPTADIVFCLGDMDKDSESEGANFSNAFKGFNEAGVPFITMCGNHDLVPDYWESGDLGVTYGLTSGHACNQKALSIVEEQWKRAQAFMPEGSEITVFRTDNSAVQQFNPFVLKYRGIQFYCGQTYWFQKLYTPPTLFTWGQLVKYWAPDPIIDQLEAYVKAHRTEGSVWMQHYPLLAGSDCDRWWLDQCKPGAAPLQNETRYATVRAKKAKYAQLMNQTKNPVHFSGHTHNFSDLVYEGIHDYTVASPGRVRGAAYIVLCREGWGVVEVKQVQF